MLTRFQYQDITWIDVERPTPEELEEVSKEFSIGPVLTEELLTPTAKPRVDVYTDCTYAVFHFPAIRHTRDKQTAQEIDVILGKDHLITVHYEPMEALDDFKRAFEAETLVGGKRKGKLPIGLVLFELAERLYRESTDELASLEDSLESIEERIFQGQEREMVTALSYAGRELLTHKRILAGHTQTLETLEKVGVDLFGEHMRTYFHGIASLHYRVQNQALALSDQLNELRETNVALLSTRQNEVMKNLTIMAFVTFPLTLIAGIFGMNTMHTPLIGTPYDFYIVLGSMVLLTVTFFAYFKIKKWF